MGQQVLLVSIQNSFSKFSTWYIRICIILPSLCYFFQNSAVAMITIDRPGLDPFQWDGCVYRRVDNIQKPVEADKCSECTFNGTKFATFKIEPKQKYRNCTEECKKPTICTTYQYLIGTEHRPECFQCEQWNGEHVHFKFIRSYEICLDECRRCARTVDLSTASLCSFKCNGKPTFSYPNQTWFGHEMYHQSNVTYGCSYKRPTNNFYKFDKGKSAKICLTCVGTTSVLEDGALCAFNCRGVPTFLKAEKNVPSWRHEILQCNLDFTAYQDVFYHDIPPEVVHYIQPNNPLAKRNMTVHGSF